MKNNITKRLKIIITITICCISVSFLSYGADSSKAEELGEKTGKAVRNIAEKTKTCIQEAKKGYESGTGNTGCEKIGSGIKTVGSNLKGFVNGLYKGLKKEKDE